MTKERNETKKSRDLIRLNLSLIKGKNQPLKESMQ